jgi:hypothetical protein
MSTRITVTLVGSPGLRKITATCGDCGQSDDTDPYGWMRTHSCS